jgi:hypothetical protein
LGASQVPDKIFLYPLPQAYLLVPFALLPLPQSFILWGVISQLVIAASCLILLNRFSKPDQFRLILPLVVILLFFGPIYLSLQIGSIGVIALTALLVAILFSDNKKSFLAGIFLSLLILKPSQGLPILFLLGSWFLIKHDWKAILGTAIGGLILLLSGLVYDPDWIRKFLDNSQGVSARTLGSQSNIYSFAYLGCNQDQNCMGIIGTVGILIVLGLAIYYLWRNRVWLTVWEVTILIIPIGFISTIYLWSYDQLLYIIPIIWIITELIKRTRSYIFAFTFMIALDILSFTALVVQAKTHADLLSIFTTIIILGFCLWLSQHKKNAPIDKPIPAV